MEEINKVEEAKQLLEQLNARIAESKEVLDRQERLKAEQILSGKAEAGAIPPKVDYEEERRKAINKWLEPTGFSI